MNRSPSAPNPRTRDSNNDRSMVRQQSLPTAIPSSNSPSNSPKNSSPLSQSPPPSDSETQLPAK